MVSGNSHDLLADFLNDALYCGSKAASYVVVLEMHLRELVIIVCSVH